MPEGVTSKQDMLAEVLTDLPEALRAKLETVIPVLVATTAPTDEASSIVTQGILAHNLNTIFKAYEGIPLLAIPLYIGQLNTVNQGILLAGLEYLEAMNVDKDFEIVNPKPGGVYLPGDVRFQVRPLNCDINQVAVEISPHAPVALDWDKGGFFWGFFRLEETAEYTATVSVLYADDKGDETTGSQTVSFSIDPNADDVAEGKDFGPVEYAFQAFKKAVDSATTAIEQEAESHSLVDTVGAYAKKTASVAHKIATIPLAVVTAINDKVGELLAADNSRGLTPGDIAVLGLIDELDTMLTGSYESALETYRKNNPHPPTGYATSPELLKGAAAAMNEQYGPGTVWYEGM